MPVSSNDVQRLFLQAILSRRILSQKLAAKLWEKCIVAVQAANEALEIQYKNDRASWDTFVTSINDALNPLDLEFAHLHDEISGQEVYAVVNRKGDEVAQMATDYSALEIAYFKAVVRLSIRISLEQIMLAPNEAFCVSSLAALREVNSLKSSMTKTVAEATLNSFVAKGWLMKSRRGRYSLSTRTVLELQTYLRTTYENEVIECTICMETRMHTHCFNHYRRRNNACPSCKEDWTTGNNLARLRPVGEAAFREGQDQRRRAPRRSTEEQEDGEGDEEEDAEPDDYQEQEQDNGVKAEPPSQPNGRGKGKRRAAPVEEVDDEDTPPPRTQQRRSSRRG
uniref:Non-structural maintenance of chromosomes element 1 homolog n=1 Tax=Ganoderma boninense TaxID=34458 RepID=A0A5K1K0I2_9APHY|nr:Argininosuccinate lyase (Probable argininosuccinate lyase) [Ganoderma boninense]